jgi:hypothetical protein
LALGPKDAITIASITPALIEIGKGGAKKIGEAGGDSVVGWLRSKMTGPAAREALGDLEAAPENPDLQAALRVQLAKLLTKEPALLAELQALLPTPGVGGDSMAQHVEGAGAKGAQIKGDGNSVTIA